MSATPVDLIFDAVDFQDTGLTPGEDGLPVAVKLGVLNIAGMRLQCAVLSDGRRMFFGDDMDEFVQTAGAFGFNADPTKVRLP